MSEQKKQYYQQLLLEYVNTSNDDILSNCQTYSNEAVKICFARRNRAIAFRNHSQSNDLTKQQIMFFDVLIEVIIGYGFTYRDYKKLLNKIKIHDKEMDVASSLQQTIKTPNPSV